MRRIYLRRSVGSVPMALGAMALPLGLFATLVFFIAPTSLAAQLPDSTFIGDARVVVDTFLVRGNVLQSEGAILETIGFVGGAGITYVDIQDAERRLWSTGAFRDLQVTARAGTAPGSRVVTFWVDEHPLVRAYRIEGLTGLSSADVLEEAAFSAPEPYAPSKIVRARQFILDGLAERGVPFAQVEERILPREGSALEVDVVLAVTQGLRVAIADVSFNGNDAIDDDQLRSVLSTQREGFWWWRKGAFRQEVLETDLYLTLPEFYASLGYLDFTVLGDTLIVDPATAKVRLEIDLAEGPRYLVDRFTIDGNRRFPTEELERYYLEESGGLLRTLGLRGGPDTVDGARIFDQPAYMAAAARIGELYRNEGYLYAQVTPELERLPPTAAGESPRVALRWDVQEGQPVYVRRINIEGNDYTHDRVIRERILLLPGDVYSEARLIRSYQAISGLGYFESPLPFPQMEPDPVTNEIDITFRVAEQQTGTLNFGTTMGGQTGLSGFIGYDQPNLFGQAKSGSLRWDFGRYQNSFSLQYSDPALLGSRISGMGSVFNSRDRFFSFATGDRKTRGASLRLGFPVPGSFFSRLFVGYSISRTEYRLRGGVDDTSLFGRPPGTQSQFNVGISRNTLDHPLFPTVGTSHSWNAEFNGGILGGDGNYTKHRIDAAWWIPVGQIGGGGPASRPIVLALGLRARGGVILGNAEAFPFDRFWVGGVQFGERLRGYEETTVTPRGYAAAGTSTVRDIDRLGDTFLTIGAEYAIRLSDAISVSAFYEAGNLWSHPREIDPSQLMRGIGIGLELMTPLGPIGVDYAWGLDRPDGGSEFHFRMGGQQ